MHEQLSLPEEETVERKLPIHAAVCSALVSSVSRPALASPLLSSQTWMRICCLLAESTVLHHLIQH